MCVMENLISRNVVLMLFSFWAAVHVLLRCCCAGEPGGVCSVQVCSGYAVERLGMQLL